MTDERVTAPVNEDDLNELKLRAGKIEAQFVSYEQHISRRFENLSAQIDNMNRLLASIASHISCITLILVAAVAAAIVGAVLACTGWFGFTQLITTP